LTPSPFAGEEKSMAQSKKRRSLPGYLDQSRSFVNSLVMMIPLLAIYEAALCLSNFKVQNRFDFLTRFVEEHGFNGLLVFNALLFFAAVMGVAYLNRRRKFDPALWPGIVIEGLSYALVLGSFTMVLLTIPGGQTAAARPNPTIVGIGLALGAGVYEELFFRLLILGTLYTWLTHTVRMQKFPALAFAFVVSSTLFSLSHFQVPTLANFDVRLFMFRFIAGIALGGIFLVRGLGVAIYTHAIFNVLMILRPL
jgi:membrane protease YdiL (CAAX protease family)